jgi:cysteine desulfurase
LLLSPLEHQSVKAPAAQLRLEGWQIEVLPVDQQGVVKLEELEKLLEPPTRLLSLVWGSAEVGTLQPMAAVAELCKAKGVLLHSDAVQVAGQVLVDLEVIPVDLLSLSAHKFQGPRGVGALLLADGVELQPQIHGGGQEGGHRSGTEPVILAAGMVKALELRQTCQPHPAEHLAQLRDHLMKHLLPLIGVRLSGPSNPKQRLPHHLSLLLSSPEGVPLSGRSMVRAMARGGVACSSGSACSSGKEIANLNLLALGLSDAEAASSLRFSFGPWLELSDLDEIPALFERCLAELSLEKLQ